MKIIPKFAYKKGHIPWNAGKHIKLNSGRTHFKKGYTPWNRGKELSQVIKDKMKGRIPWNKGKTKKELPQLSNSGVKKGQLSWEKHPNWRGNRAKYDALHSRVRKILGQPKLCKICKTHDNKKLYHWANLTGNFLDIKDYKRMCVKCHIKYDSQRRNGKEIVRKGEK